MLSLSIIGYGENIQTFVAFLQAELRAFIKQNSAYIYNLKTLWKAESSVELLKKSSRLILRSDKDADCEYWGILSVDDWNALHSKFFSSIALDEECCNRQINYTSSHLKSILQRYAMKSSEDIIEDLPYDFRVTYRYEKNIDLSELCILKITTKLSVIDALEPFRKMISKLDALFPNIFLSAYIDDAKDESHKLHFENEMLKYKIIDTGKAFYICNNIKEVNKITSADESGLNLKHHLSNGTFYVLPDDYNKDSCNISLIDKILLPHYIVLNWSDFASNTELQLPFFDTLSIYFDRYSPSDPTMVFSCGYVPKQLDALPMIYDLICQKRYFQKDILTEF